MPMKPPLREMICELMPTASPSRLISGPPELPGLTATSVWMKGRYSPVSRPMALTMPDVTVESRPNGEPMASTHCPFLSFLGSPMTSGVMPLGLDLDQGDVGALVRADDLGLEFAAVGQRDVDVGRVDNHVVIGEDVAVFGDEEARSRAARHGALFRLRRLRTLPRRGRLLARRLEIRSEEPAEQFIGIVAAAHPRTAHRHGGGGADVDDGGVGFLDDGREIRQGHRRRLRQEAGA